MDKVNISKVKKTVFFFLVVGYIILFALTVIAILQHKLSFENQSSYSVEWRYYLLLFIKYIMFCFAPLVCILFPIKKLEGEYISKTENMFWFIFVSALILYALAHLFNYIEIFTAGLQTLSTSTSMMSCACLFICLSIRNLKKQID